MTPVLRLFVVLLLALSAIPSAVAQEIAYHISFPNAAHHEAQVEAVFTDVPDGALALRMSRTSPGRYALHEFAKNVYGFTAMDGAGRPLEVTRPNPHQWDVAGHDGTVRVSYTLFGNRADGTYAGIDNTQAHLNIPASFVWARGLDDAPITITFARPDPAWTIATQLHPTDDPETFTAPNLAYFLDSPTHLGDIGWRTWDVTSEGKTHTIRLAVHHAGTEEDLDRFAEMVRKVVAEQIALFGETPDYETGTYTFIATYLPYVYGDGMEHRNSTILTSQRPLDGEGALRNLGTVSHEFFHQWNVERLRPAALEPFDFEEANMTSELWFAEGFTSYYDDLFIRRAGLTDDAAYARGLSGTVTAVVNTPGRRFFSPMEMSMQAPFVDAATSVDPQNKRNTFLSYYTWGAGLGLALDLTLRSRFDGVTLDDYMRALWERFGEPETPYTHADLKQTLADVTGDAAFADEFFDQYIEGRAAPDYAALLDQAGFVLRQARAGNVWLGASVEDSDDRVAIASGTLFGSPFYEAGLDEGDVLLAADGAPIESAEAFRALADTASPGDRLPITFEQRGEARQATLVFTQDPALEVVTYEEAGMTPSAAQLTFRRHWLHSRTGL